MEKRRHALLLRLSILAAASQLFGALPAVQAMKMGFSATTSATGGASNLLVTAPYDEILGRTSHQRTSEIEANEVQLSVALPDLLPLQFLLVSSPAMAKVSYVELTTFRAKSGHAAPLIDSGLVEPAGLAFDVMTGHLYLADRSQRKIFRYTIGMQAAGGGHRLFVEGVQLCILANVTVEWIAVDPSGAVLYTDRDTNTINKISKGLIERMYAGEIVAEDLRFLTHKQLAGLRLDQQLQAGHVAVQNKAVEILYDGSKNDQVALPAGIACDGVQVVWANGAGASGDSQVTEVARGMLHPASLKTSGLDVSTVPLVNGTDPAYGVAKTTKLVFYTTLHAGVGEVVGVSQSGGDSAPAVTVTTGLTQPRGLTWDGDSTLYIADQATSKVWSMPAGRLYSGVPISPVVDIAGAYGLALVSPEQRAFAEMHQRGALSGASSQRSSGWGFLDYLDLLDLATWIS